MLRSPCPSIRIAWSLVLHETLTSLYLEYVLEFLQMLEDLQGLLALADEKRQASLTELSLKHQKVKFMQTSGKPLQYMKGSFFWPYF